MLPGQRLQQRDVLVALPLHLPVLQRRYLLALARGDESAEHPRYLQCQPAQQYDETQELQVPVQHHRRPQRYGGETLAQARHPVVRRQPVPEHDGERSVLAQRQLRVPEPRRDDG